MIRVLIADDSNAVLEGLASLLCPEYGFEVVGIARDGLQAIEKAQQLLPDVIIMDAQMPNMDGIEATEQIKLRLPAAKVLCFSVFTDYMEAGLTAGADGYLPKDCDPGDLVAELKRMAGGAGPECSS